MQRLVSLRRWLAAVGMVLPLAAVSLPALAADAEFEQARDAWSTNREQLTEASEGLEALDVATAEATAAFEEVEARLASAVDRLRELRAELERARRLQRKADQANDVAIRRLGQATMVLVTIEDALAEHAADLDVEVVAAYKYGGSSAQFRGIVDALQQTGSISEFTNAYEQLRSATVGQSQLVSTITSLADQLTDQRVIVRTLQRQTEKAERDAQQERRRVAVLTNEQTALVAEIRSDRAERKRLLTTLVKQQAEYERRVLALQAESDALMETLRQYRWVGGAPGSKDLLWPTDGTVTSGFGYRNHPIFKQRRLHAGIDIPAETGQPIYAPGDGTVVLAGSYGGYGNAVVIDHGDGMQTVYAHQSKIGVSDGQEVLAGDTIGYVGSTGFSTGPHLHFEIRLGGTPTNPLDWY